MTGKQKTIVFKRKKRANMFILCIFRLILDIFKISWQILTNEYLYCQHKERLHNANSPPILAIDNLPFHWNIFILNQFFLKYWRFISNIININPKFNHHYKFFRSFSEDCNIDAILIESIFKTSCFFCFKEIIKKLFFPLKIKFFLPFTLFKLNWAHLFLLNSIEKVKKYRLLK